VLSTAGRKPFLEPEQQMALEAELVKSSRAHGYATEPPTVLRAQDLICKLFCHEWDALLVGISMASLLKTRKKQRVRAK